MIRAQDSNAFALGKWINRLGLVGWKVWMKGLRSDLLITVSWPGIGTAHKKIEHEENIRHNLDNNHFMQLLR